MSDLCVTAPSSVLCTYLFKKPVWPCFSGWLANGYMQLGRGSLPGPNTVVHSACGLRVGG